MHMCPKACFEEVVVEVWGLSTEIADKVRLSAVAKIGGELGGGAELGGIWGISGFKCGEFKNKVGFLVGCCSRVL